MFLEAVPNTDDHRNKKLVWSQKDRGSQIFLSGPSISHTGVHCENLHSMIRTTRCIHPTVKQYYFEMTVKKSGENGVIGIGLTTRSIESRNGEMPGWNNGSIGFHGDDGKIYHDSGSGMALCEPYGAGDTIGCCLKRIEIFGKIEQFCFFTLNGIRLEPSRNLGEGDFFPTVGMGCSGAEVETNLGQTEFMFNIPGKLAV